MWFELEIHRPARPPMRDVFQAQTVEWARYQAERKYPGAIVFVPEESSKPSLARSYDGPKKATQRRLRRIQQESRS
jgi:hypothetical protein